MCGRYVLSRPQRFAELNALRLVWKPRARYNVAPMQTVAVVLDESPDAITEARWGLVPVWAKDAKIGAQCINARCETVAEKPAFRAAYNKRRCLIPADGFYEWQRVGSAKVPHLFSMRDGEPFAFAGLWETWHDPATPAETDPLRTVTIITGPPNALVAPVHDRMPVILPRERYAEWLSSETPETARAAMLAPFAADAMRAVPVSSRVGSPRNDDASLIEPVESPANDRKQPPSPPKRKTHSNPVAQGELF